MAADKLKFRGVVYLLHNTVENKSYIGQTTRTLSLRCKDHLASVREGSKLPLHQAIRENTFDVFTPSIITEASSQEQLDKLEILWILTLGTYLSEVGYNMTFGGHGPGMHTDQTKLKIKLSGKKRIGMKFSTEHRLNLSLAHKGKAPGNKGLKMSSEQREKLSIKHKGKILSEEHKSKISDGVALAISKKKGKLN